MSYDVYVRILIQLLGELVCLRVFGTPFIIIEHGETAIELLKKRGSIYSDRPRLTMAGDMLVFSMQYLSNSSSSVWTTFPFIGAVWMV